MPTALLGLLVLPARMPSLTFHRNDFQMRTKDDLHQQQHRGCRGTLIGKERKGHWMSGNDFGITRTRLWIEALLCKYEYAAFWLC